MKIFCGANLLWCGKYWITLIAWGLALAVVEIEQLANRDVLPNPLLVKGFLGLIAIEQVARLGRSAVDGYYSDRYGMVTMILRGLLENLGWMTFYSVTAVLFHLLQIMFTGFPDSGFYAATQTIKLGAFFTMGVISIVLSVVQIRGEEGAYAFFRHLFETIWHPKDGAQGIINDKTGRDE